MADVQTRAKLLNNLVVRNLKCQMKGGPNKQGAETVSKFNEQGQNKRGDVGI